MLIKKIQNKKGGFTLIELLVSMALFAICIVIILGAITSITDANRKARSLMTVMNNLSFSVDAMTRSFNTGKSPSVENCDGVPDSGFSTTEINYREINSASDAGASWFTRNVKYCLEEIDGIGQIVKYVGGSGSPITSPDIDIEYAKFAIGDGVQPILLINLEGTVQVGGKISSTFTLQNSVSQKYLNIQ